MKKKVLTTAVVGLLAVGVGQSAHASPYGFASTTYNNFLITLSNATPNGGSISTNTSQNYPGTTHTGGTVTNTFTAADSPGVGATAPNAFGGPNVTYTAASPAAVTTSTPSPIVESSLKGGNGAQAVSSVGALNVFSGPGDGAIGAVENGGVSPPGTITSNSSQRENVFTFTTSGSAGTVTFGFDVQVFAEALTTGFGETASASTNNSITQSCLSGACVGTGTNTFAPAALQLGVTSGPFVGDFTQGNQLAFITGVSQTFNLLANSTYQFSLASVLTETTSSIPEPASLAVLGTAMLGLAGVVRRRRKI